MDDNPYALFSLALSAALQRLRDRHGDMTILQSQAFLLVAANPGISQIEIARVLGMSDGTASRTFGILADIGRRDRGLDGLDLIKMIINPDDRRLRALTLTPKGRRLMDDIMTDLTLKRR